jgi:hypothetical protein
MEGLVLDYLTRDQADKWFVDKYPALFAGTDERAKRAAYYKLIDEMVTGGSLPPAARRWQYPFYPAKT